MQEHATPKAQYESVTTITWSSSKSTEKFIELHIVSCPANHAPIEERLVALFEFLVMKVCPVNAYLLCQLRMQ